MTDKTSLMTQNESQGLPAPSSASSAIFKPRRGGEIQESGLDSGSGEAQQFQLRRLHQYMRGYYWIAIVLLIIGGAIGGFFGFKSGKKIYASSGLIRVMPVVPKILYSVEDKGALPMFDSFVDSQVAVMQSQRVLGKAMEDKEWQSLGRGISDRSAEEFAGEISVSDQGGMLRVMAIDPDPNAATIDVKTLITAYLAIFDEQDAQSGEKRLVLLNDRRTELTSQLATKKQIILEIGNAYKTDDLKSKCQFQEERLNKIDITIDDKKRLLAGIERNSSTTQPTNGMVSEEQLASMSPKLAALLQERDGLQKQLELFKIKGILPKNQDVVETTQLQNINGQAIEKLENNLRRSFADGTLSGGELGRQQLKDELDGLQTDRAAIDEKLSRMGGDMLKIEQLRNEVNEITGERDETDRRIQELQVEAQITGRLQVISYGDRPLAPYKDTRITNSAAGGFGGGVLGFCIVAAFAFMDRRLRSPDQAEGGAINAPMLGMLPRLPDDLSDPAQAITAAHCVHEIRTLLQIWSRRSRHRVFAMTSPNPGAGKTSLTLALGASYATANLRTLIIDCDLVGGGLTSRAELIIKRMFGQILLRDGLITEEQLLSALQIASETDKKVGQVLVDQGVINLEDLESAVASQFEQPVGILDAMHGVPIEQCVARTSIPNLHIMPVGAGTARDVPLLSPEALHQLIASLSNQFDVVLVDTGPILGSLEASLVAGIVDGVVLVVRKGDRRPTFERAMSQLVAVGARVAGVVFNGASPEDIVQYGRSSGGRSQKSGATDDGMGSAPAASPVPGSYGPLTTAVANFAPAINRNSARQ